MSNINIFNTDKKYQIIYADPAWSYQDKNCQGAAQKHYNTMSADEICNLPIKNITDKNAILFMWATYPKLDEALKVIEAWGFKYRSIAFQWIKLNKSWKVNDYLGFQGCSMTLGEMFKKSCFFGLGRWTRGNSEPCLIATKGNPKRISPNVGQLVFSPIRRHSAKPPEVRDKIVELVGGGTRIELFARESANGWDCWGNEAPED